MLPLARPAPTSGRPARPSADVATTPTPPPALPPRRAVLASLAGVAAASLLAAAPARADAPAAASFAIAEAEEEGIGGGVSSSSSPTSQPYASVYFGSGCFWGRQKDFVDAERALGRSPSDVTALSGYAGGKINDKATCYYYVPPTDRAKIYEKQGHCEVVALDLGVGNNRAAAEKELAAFADVFFTRQFVRTRDRGGGTVMGRLDPQDRGPGYRCCVGLPGGAASPLFAIVQAANVNGMDLRPGLGNEKDIPGVVWVYDANALPFHRAEAWHQMHPGLAGEPFPRSYLVDQKKASVAAGRAVPVPGCPELPF